MAIDPGTIGTFVRNWLHYDKLVTSLSKQTSNTKKVRDEYEKKIIDYLQQHSMENAVIQTGSGLINIVSDHVPKQLSLTRIGSLLDEYSRLYPNKLCNSQEIMEFIHTNRGSTEIKHLKMKAE